MGEARALVSPGVPAWFVQRDADRIARALATRDAALVAAVAAERERCAGIAEEYEGPGTHRSWHAPGGDAVATQHGIASEIRNPTGGAP